MSCIQTKYNNINGLDSNGLEAGAGSLVSFHSDVIFGYYSFLLSSGLFLFRFCIWKHNRDCKRIHLVWFSFSFLWCDIFANNFINWIHDLKSKLWKSRTIDENIQYFQANKLQRAFIMIWYTSKWEFKNTWEVISKLCLDKNQNNYVVGSRRKCPSFDITGSTLTSFPVELTIYNLHLILNRL